MTDRENTSEDRHAVSFAKTPEAKRPSRAFNKRKLAIKGSTSVLSAGKAAHLMRLNVRWEIRREATEKIERSEEGDSNPGSALEYIRLINRAVRTCSPIRLLFLVLSRIYLFASSERIFFSSSLSLSLLHLRPPLFLLLLLLLLLLALEAFRNRNVTPRPDYG